MLQKAYDYQDKINSFMRDLDNEKYLQYYNICGYTYNVFIKHEDDEYNYISRVSLHPKQKELIGLFGAHLSRTHDVVTEISIVNFTKKASIILVKDMLSFIHTLFTCYHFRKIRFSIITANPFQEICERILPQLAGRVIGTALSEFKLINGQIGDIKYYEVLKSDYISSPVYNKLKT